MGLLLLALGLLLLALGLLLLALGLLLLLLRRLLGLLGLLLLLRRRLLRRLLLLLLRHRSDAAGRAFALLAMHLEVLHRVRHQLTRHRVGERVVHACHRSTRAGEQSTRRATAA